MIIPLPRPDTAHFAALAAHLGETVSQPPTLAQQALVYRLARGTTQQALADAAGQRRATVADIEAGRGAGRNPKLAAVRALARALGAPLVVFPADGP